MESYLKELNREQLAAATETAHIDELRVSVLGRKGELTALLKGMGKLSKEERPVVGQMVNELRAELEGLLDAKAAEFAEKEKNARLAAETLDISIPGDTITMGNEHPLSSTLEKLISIFTSMGFSVAEGP